MSRASFPKATGRLQRMRRVRTRPLLGHQTVRIACLVDVASMPGCRTCRRGLALTAITAWSRVARGVGTGISDAGEVAGGREPGLGRRRGRRRDCRSRAPATADLGRRRRRPRPGRSAARGRLPGRRPRGAGLPGRPPPAGRTAGCSGRAARRRSSRSVGRASTGRARRRPGRAGRRGRARRPGPAAAESWSPACSGRPPAPARSATRSALERAVAAARRSGPAARPPRGRSRARSDVG